MPKDIPADMRAATINRDRIKALESDLAELNKERRRLGRKLLKHGLDKVKVSDLTGVSRQTVHSWVKKPN